MLLIEKGVWTAITTDPPNPITDSWTQKDEKAHTTIALNVEDDQIQHIRHCETAKSAWNNLKDFHEKDTPNNKVSILRQLMTTRLEERGNVEAHVTKMTELFQRFIAYGDDLKPEFILCVTILSSLPESYDVLVTTLENRKDELTSSIVCSAVIAEYRKRLERNRDNTEAVLRVSSSAKKGSLNTKEEAISVDKSKCLFCKRKGHWKKDCRKLLAHKQKKSQEQQVNSAETSGAVQHLFATMMPHNDGWLVDSGATNHMVSKREFFTNMKKHVESIYVANGHKVTAIGKGTVNAKFINKLGDITAVSIANVLYVPQIQGNFISVRRLTKIGYTVTFDNEECNIIRAHDGVQIALGEIYGNLYKLKTPNTICAIRNQDPEPMKNCIHKWHSILGHRDIQVVKTLPSSDLVNGVYFDECSKDCNNILNCEVCLQGKMSRMKFPDSNNRAKEKLDLIHSDVCGPMQTATPSGKRYVLTFIDDYSKFTAIYLIKEKSEVFGKLREFMEICKTMFNRKPKMIRTDRGGEYMSIEFIKFLDREGIRYQRTAPYSPQQNGVAERKNRTLIEMARCMILEAKLENKFWGEAVVMANYIQNRLPAKDTVRTPFENWYGTKPNLNFFKRFGSKCYVHISDEKRKKLDSKATEATFVGYDAVSKAYRCYVPSNGKVIISRDVKFVYKGSNWKIHQEEVKEENELIITHPPEDEFYSADDEENRIEEEDPALDEALRDNQQSPIAQHGINEDAPVNDANNIRRSTRSNFGVPPLRYTEKINTIKEELIEPKTYNQAIHSEYKNEWIQAMKNEIKSLQENKTWELMELPKDRRAIGCKWVYKIKTHGENKVFKARLVAQGFSQKYGIEYDEVFAPVVKHATYRILLTIAARKQMKVIHLDAKTAFLNGKLDETIYMKQPPGFTEEGNEHQVCLLRRSIYGLKQSARVWNKTIHQVLTDAGYVQSKNDPCLYILEKDGKLCYILIYVDDVIMASEDDNMLKECEQILCAEFKIKNLGDIQNYLGLQIKRDLNGNFALNQKQYIMKIIKDFGMMEAKTSNVPISVSYGKENSESLIDNENYRKLVGCLLYIAVNTRPDISASVTILAQKVTKPTQEDWNELKRIIRYLKGTVDLSLILSGINGKTDLIGYADANWAEDVALHQRKSTTGYIFKYFDSVISWCSKRQTCVAKSSMEAEYIALSEASSEALWIRRLLRDFKQPVKDPTVIYEDNQSCLKLIKEEKLSNRSKHIDVHAYFVKDHVDKGTVKCIYCPTEDMIADLLTKPLPASRIIKLRKHCDLMEI